MVKFYRNIYKGLVAYGIGTLGVIVVLTFLMATRDLTISVSINYLYMTLGFLLGSEFRMEIWNRPWLSGLIPFFALLVGNG